MKTNFLAMLLVVGLASPVWAEVQARTITYEHAGKTFKGYLAYDDAVKGKRPGILLVHEWWGLNDYARMRVKKLAEMGYVAFALDMYGEGKVTEHPMEASKWASMIRMNQQEWQARARSGLDILKKQPQTDSNRLPAIGYCFGGSTVLQLAYSGADLDAVVSFHGALPQPTPEQVENIKGKILICHGAEDSFIPEKHIQGLRTALEKSDVDYQMIYYANARHSFTVPGADERGIEGIRYEENADRRSWQHMRMLFDEVFGKLKKQ